MGGRDVDADGQGGSRSDESDALKVVAESLARLTRELRNEPPDAGLQQLVGLAATELVGAQWASITVLRGGTFRTVARSEPVADQIDLAQYRAGVGPCVDALLEDSTYVTGDIASEPKWHPLGRQLNEQFGVRSMLAYRLHLLDESEAIAGLNLSAPQPDAFDTADVHRGRVLATHCALLVTASLAQDKATHLLRALESNREIGVAIGVLMARHQLNREQAFDVLRVASQRSNRKLVDVAIEVADTGLAPPGVADVAKGL
jgi:hypothetical protein